jgi:NitT/TauT family transport system permease protein
MAAAGNVAVAGNVAAAGRRSWLRPFGELPPRQRATLGALAFLIPIGLWCVVSYVPFIWHPMIRVADPGDIDWMTRDQIVESDAFYAENQAVAGRGGRPARGSAANPVFLPAPHQVARALVTGFTTPPARPDEPWLHQALLHSIGIIFWGFLLSSVVGVPLGILCGALPATARLTEPFVEFFRYLPAPAFGALAVAVLGINDAPKISIIFIGTFFQQVLVVANTTRRLDPALLEAAQTLGAKSRQLLWRVVVPGIATDLYADMRVLLGWAWTYLIVAELIGVSSGITFFINQQAKYRAYDRVFASIILIGLIGLFTDVLLASIGRQIFPWMRTSRAGWLSQAFQVFRRRDRRHAPAPLAPEPHEDQTHTSDPAVAAGEVVS